MTEPSLAEVIAHLETTDPDTWWPGPTYRSPDGTQHCALSHIETRWGMDVMDWFEDRWSTSYVIGAVNDGTHPGYPQAHPKDRCLAYVRALADGSELSTPDSMELQYAMGRSE
jgi:hypothetical protein